MRIFSYIILLLASTAFFVQGTNAQTLGVESARSYVVPGSSAAEAAASKSDIKRFAIPVDGWEQTSSLDGVTFSSSFDSPFSWISRQSIISISGASAPYTLYVDGQSVGSCFNPSMPSEFNLTQYLKQEANTPISITLHTDLSTSELEAWRQTSVEEPKLGQVVMISQPVMYVRDVEVSTSLNEGGLNASIAIAVKSEALNPRTSRISYELISPSGRAAVSAHADLSLDMRREDTIYLSAFIPDSLAWSASSPNLYKLNISTQYRGRYIEYQSFDIGLRSVEMSSDGDLLINGEVQELKTAEVNSSADLKSLQELKENGYNTIKIAAGDHNRDLYSIADSIGLYVIATAPINTSHSGGDILKGGNPTNDPSRVDEYIERVDALYYTTRIHPSVIAYSLADNSLNGINLYEGYLYLKAREKQRPIIYKQSGGEWNDDRLNVEY